MKAVVVYQSLWGNTAAIAHAIAEGLGSGAVALSTTEATAQALAGADVVVAGAPVHFLNLPTRQSVESARSQSSGPEGIPTDVSHKPMRDWLHEFPKGTGAATAAFDTRIRGLFGRGGATRILKALDRAGLTPVTKPEGFYVAAQANQGVPKGTLLTGEVERARQWGRDLAAKAS